MKKNDAFQFTAPNGAVVNAVVLYLFNRKLEADYIGFTKCIGYAQNRIFECSMTFRRKYFAGFKPKGEDNPVVLNTVKDIKVITDYAVIPECDEILSK